MDESTFQKELNKYKIVRPAEHYKNRIVSTKKIEGKTSTRPQPSSTHRGKESRPSVVATDFLELLSATNSSVLTASESIKFVDALKLGHERISEKLSLYDLDLIAAELKAT